MQKSYKIWKIRNKFIFENVIPNSQVHGLRSMTLYKDYFKRVKSYCPIFRTGPSFNFSSQLVSLMVLPLQVCVGEAWCLKLMKIRFSIFVWGLALAVIQNMKW